MYVQVEASCQPRLEAQRAAGKLCQKIFSEGEFLCRLCIMMAKNRLRRESDLFQRQGGDPLPSNRTCYSMFLHLSIKTTCCFSFVEVFMFNINMKTGFKAKFFNTACKMSTIKQGLKIEVTLCFTFTSFLV
jgi:hypothetical protein